LPWSTWAMMAMLRNARCSVLDMRVLSWCLKNPRVYHLSVSKP